MPGEFPYDIFLSHSAKDKPVVRDGAERLRKDGLRVWFDERQNRPGDIHQAETETVKAFIAALTVPTRKRPTAIDRLSARDVLFLRMQRRWEEKRMTQRESPTGS